MTLMTGFVSYTSVFLAACHELNTQVHVWLFVSINRAERHLENKHISFI